jgi:hypothetical protein
MGEPKATDMPEAAAAERTSLLRAILASVCLVPDEMDMRRGKLTLVVIDIGEQLDEEVRTAARYVNQRTLLSEPHS